MPTVPDVPPRGTRRERDYRADDERREKEYRRRKYRQAVVDHRRHDARVYPRPDKHADRIEDEAGLHRSHDSLDDSLFKLFVRIVQIKYAHRADYDGAENEHDMDVLAVDDDAGEYEAAAMASIRMDSRATAFFSQLFSLRCFPLLVSLLHFHKYDHVHAGSPALQRSPPFSGRPLSYSVRAIRINADSSYFLLLSIPKLLSIASALIYLYYCNLSAARRHNSKHLKARLVSVRIQSCVGETSP